MSETINKNQVDHERNLEIYSLYNENHKLRNLNFLSDDDNKKAKYKNAIACFPRTGSSLTINILENLTGYFATDDMSITVSKESILKGNYRGSLDFVDIVRTHYPLLNYNSFCLESLELSPYKIKRAIVLTRNPLKCYVSFISFMKNSTHDSENIPVNSSEIDKFLKGFSLGYNKLYSFWLEVSKKIPIMFFRYEDIMINPVEQYTKMLSFLKKEVEPEKIKDYFEKNGLKSTFKDKPQKTDHEKDYKDDQIKYVKEMNKEWFNFFGYNEEDTKEPEFIKVNELNKKSFNDIKEEEIIPILYQTDKFNENDEIHIAFENAKN